jgi:hypothetical protein
MAGCGILLCADCCQQASLHHAVGEDAFGFCPGLPLHISSAIYQRFFDGYFRDHDD